MAVSLNVSICRFRFLATHRGDGCGVEGEDDALLRDRVRQTQVLRQIERRKRAEGQRARCANTTSRGVSNKTGKCNTKDSPATTVTLTVLLST